MSAGRKMRYVFAVARDHRDFDARIALLAKARGWTEDRLCPAEVNAVFRIEARVETLDSIASIMAEVPA